jgi:acetyl-CoA acetyltransferase
MDLVEYDMTKRPAKAAMAEAGIAPNDIKVCELHDCFLANELILLDGLGFSEPGKRMRWSATETLPLAAKVLLSISPADSFRKGIR